MNKGVGMNAIAVESGVILGFGGTNARFGASVEGDITGFRSIETPADPGEFFGWMARQALDAAENGNEWMVAGFPGPVSPDGRMVGPMPNIPGLAADRYDIKAALTKKDNAMHRLLEQGFRIVAVNDGELAAQAAADRIGQHKYNKTAALIIGSGVGAGIVNHDPSFVSVHRADRTSPAEIGHLPQGDDPTETPETAISGTAIEARFGDPREIPANHPIWAKVGGTAGRLATTLSLMHGAELVVVTGGVGGGASSKYGPHLERFMSAYREFGNGPQKLFAPEVVAVPEDDAQVFELYGGVGVMRDFQTRAA
jgi:predicted NBD/HSP70 family sugar kinase